MALTFKHGVLATSCVALVLLVLMSSAHASRTRARSRTGSRARSSGGRRSNSVAQTRFTCQNKLTFNVTLDDLQRRPFVTQCPRAPVVDLRVTAVRGRCSGTTAALRSLAKRCEWNATCTVPFNSQDHKMRTTDRGDFYLCSDEPPEHYLIQYSCIKRNAEVKSVLGAVQRTNKPTGLVKSHTLYPWSYRDGQELGNITFIKPRRTRSPATLWITVGTFAIKDTDLVFLSWQNNSHSTQNVDAYMLLSPDNATYSVLEAERVTLTFYADYSRHHSEVTGPDEGFLLCYQWLPANAKLKKGSACSKVLQPGKCRSRGGSTNRRGSNRRPRNRGNRRQSSSNRNRQ